MKNVTLNKVVKIVTYILMTLILIFLRGGFFIMLIRKWFFIEKIILVRDVNPNGIFS